VLPRDRARLLVLDPSDGLITHRLVSDLPELLSPGDLLVVNDTKVRCARVTGRRQSSGAPVDMLFVSERPDRTWEVLVKGKWRPGDVVEVGPAARIIVIGREEGRTGVRIETSLSVEEFFQRYGQMPLPPYIKRAPTEKDREWYQTLFAHQEGAIAAPTAGLHFTGALLDRLDMRGIWRARITLHVGIGTFKPVTASRIEDHRMGAEWLEVSEKTVRAVDQCKEAGGRLVAVGTTVVRALESAVQEDGRLKPYRGATSLFITPGFPFRAVDALITNFHLPRTTLLMLVSAFGGTDLIRRAYEEAVRRRYRFYSYGDAMLILRKAQPAG
jgi:S-adenosylmethionine:tRNA ribosyltransferase-isomerase